MKLALTVALVAPCATTAFAPSAFSAGRAPTTSSTSRSMAIDPLAFANDLPHHASALNDAFSSLLVSDLGISTAVDAATSAVQSGSVDNVAEAAGAAAGATDAAAAASGNGWFGFFAGPIEFLLQVIHKALVGVGVPANAWGVSIVLMTFIIKVLTYPLTKSQLESTSKMQTLQPTIKEIQAKYQSNPEVMNQKIAEIYQTNNVNPLAGCIPSLAQIPIFIGLYRAILNLAKNDKLEEPFLWLPNLEGPTYGADPATASDWIFKGWHDGVPSLGWDDTIAFLTIPVILIASQYLSMQLMQPKVEGQEQPVILKFLPLMIGWFSLNVPAALGIYWVANNFITTAISVQIRSGLDSQPVVTSGGGGSSVMDAPTTTSAFTPAPMREKPSGFADSASSSPSSDGVTPITAIDSEDVDTVAEEVTVGESSAPTPKPKKQRGKKKKKKKRS